MKYENLTAEQVKEAVMKRIGGMDGALELLRGNRTIQSCNNPPVFSKNRNGHYSIEIIGDRHSGENFLKDSGEFCVGSGVRYIIESDDYKQNHRLEDGKKYTVVLILGKDMGWKFLDKHTTQEVLSYAQNFGYDIPLAGIMPQVRRIITGEEKGQMDDYCSEFCSVTYFVKSTKKPVRLGLVFLLEQQYVKLN